MTDALDFLNKKKTGQKLTKHAKSCLVRALSLAADLGSSHIMPAHLLWTIMAESGSMGSTLLLDIGIKDEYFPFFQKQPLHPINPVDSDKSELPGTLPFSNDLKSALAKAWFLAHELNYPYVGTEHLAYAILESKDGEIQKILSKMKPKKNNAKKLIPREDLDLENMSDVPFSSNDPLMALIPDFLGPAGKNSKHKQAPSHISKYCANLNEEIKERGDVITGRADEVGRMINILSRRNKNNPLLIGHPGVGKTALVSLLADKINTGDVPDFLIGKKIMSLDVASLIAGTSFRGEFESRLKEIVNEAQNDKSIILFIDEIHNIVGAGNIAGSLDLANILKPALAKGKIQLIGATTLNEFKRHIEKDAALERRFQTVIINEPSILECKKILVSLKPVYENFHNVSITDDNIGLVCDLASRYIPGRYFPDKAIDVLDETAGRVRAGRKLTGKEKQIRDLELQKKSIGLKKEQLVSKEQYEQAIALRAQEKDLEKKIRSLRLKHCKEKGATAAVLERRDIIETVAQISGVQVEKVAEERNRRFKNISGTMNERIIGQKEAIEKISSVLLRSQFGLNDEERPLGSFMFLGPSGTGKTLTAKTIAREFFSSGSSLIKIDMSEFGERHSVSALIGSPAGYVGYGEGGRLTEHVKRNPHSVVLFDEIEKAHPDVTNILLQILEDGILTDAEGAKVSFKQAIIILTSNIETGDLIGSPKVGFKSTAKKISRKDAADSQDETRSRIMTELERYLRPELLNRLDYIVPFKALGEKELLAITRMELTTLKARLGKKKISLKIRPEAEKFIAKKSLSKNQGARLIRKNIQELVEHEIARMIMEEKVKGGKIEVGMKNGKLILK